MARSMDQSSLVDAQPKPVRRLRNRRQLPWLRNRRRYREHRSKAQTPETHRSRNQDNRRWFHNREGRLTAPNH